VAGQFGDLKAGYIKYAPEAITVSGAYSFLDL
jgi:hypothetical protein